MEGVKASRGSRSADAGASGEGDLPMMRKKELGRDAVATGRKAVKGRRAKKEAGSWSGDVRVPKDAVATGRRKAAGKSRPKSKAAEAKMVAAEAGTEGGGVRLSQDYINYVLSWKPEVLEDPDELYARMIKSPAFSLEDVERRAELQRELVEQSKECAASVESFHAWVRDEFNDKGYVQVDDDYIAQGVLLRQALEEDQLYALAFGPIDGLVAGR